MSHSLVVIFCKNHLDPQYVLSLEIFGGFCWIEVMVRFRFSVRVYGHGFGVGVRQN